MPRRISARQQEGPEFACRGGPGRYAGGNFLDLDERSCAARDAGVVEAAGAAAVAVSDVYQVARHRACRRSGLRCKKTVGADFLLPNSDYWRQANSLHFPHSPDLAASLRIIARRMPACARRSSTTAPA